MKVLTTISIWLLTLTYAMGQFDFTKRVSGLIIRTGFSNSIDEKANSNASSNIYGSASIGVYHLFVVNSKNESLIPFHYLKTELNFGSRGGLFSIDDLNQTGGIRTSYVDLVVITPLSWEINDHLAANLGIGAGLGFVRNQTLSTNIKPAPNLDYGSPFRTSFVIDYHFLFIGSGNAMFGARSVIESSKFSFFEWSLYFGFSLPGKKIRKVN